MIDFKKELNKGQYEVASSGDGPVLVLAGAGSGKTRALTYRVAYLIEQKVDPSRILLLTFTNKAAHEMMTRVDALVKDSKLSKKVWGGTFHHVAHRLLRKMGSAVGLKNNFIILDREDSKDLLKRITKGMADASGKRLPQPGLFLEVISYAVSAQVSIEDALIRKFPDGLDRIELFTRVAQEYEARKKQGQLVDFDDLLLYWLRLLNLPKVREKMQGLWEYILVDEYQDTNVVQDTIVRILGEKHKNVLVVGDDAQSIYSFRAADISNILNFPKAFPNTKTIRLEENYRSTPEILEVANHLISQNERQFKKELFTTQESSVKPELMVAQDPSEEAEMVTERIIALENEGVDLSNIAVLFRAAHQSQELELELNRRAIPYEMRGGIRFFERAHIKDALAYVKIVANIQDEVSWSRILQLYEGIGDAGAQKIIVQVRECGTWESVQNQTMTLGANAAKGWGAFMKHIGIILPKVSDGPAELLRAVAKSYREYAISAFTDYKDRLDDLEQFALFAERYDDVDDFLAETTLQEAFAVRPGTESKDEKGVVLSTIHQAKGLEWHTVFITHLTQNSIPHPKAMMEKDGLEEERRLMYVAITRAQRRLYLLYPLSTSRYTVGLNQPSQFLQEIDPQMLNGTLELDDSERYINVDEDGNRSYLPSIDRL